MSAPDNHEDRRTAPRYAVDLPARFWTGDGAGQLEGRIRDVSWGGLFLQSPELEPTGTAIQLLVGLTRPGSSVPLRGEVVWSGTEAAKGTGMGIRLETPL